MERNTPSFFFLFSPFPSIVAVNERSYDENPPQKSGSIESRFSAVSRRFGESRESAIVHKTEQAG
jgi:hypothetical protein